VRDPCEIRGQPDGPMGGPTPVGRGPVGNAVETVRDGTPHEHPRDADELGYPRSSSGEPGTPSRDVLVAVSVLTGIRQGEALGLRWQDVDVKTGVVRVRFQLDRQGNLVEPKTSTARRDVPIPASLARMLVEHRLASNDSNEADFVFASETGGQMHYNNIVRRGLDKAVVAAKLPHLRWHDLRHLAASALIAESEGDVDRVSRVLGHASASITQAVYAHEF
jgi:integrase